MKEKRTADSSGDVRLLPVKKQGRKVLLGESLDAKVHQYVMRARQGGGAASAGIVMVAGRGILLLCSQSRLAEFGGDVEITWHWP